MKRLLTILLLFVVLSLIFVQVVYREQFDLWQHVKAPFTESDEPRYEGQARAVVAGNHAVGKVSNSSSPGWSDDPSKTRLLNLHKTIGGESGFEFRKATALASDEEGRLYVLDYGNKSIEIFAPDGAHTASVGRGRDNELLLSKPTDVTVSHDGKLYVSDRRKGILVFSADGQWLQTLPMPAPVWSLALNSKRELIVLTPANPYLLHKFDLEGEALLAFGHQEEETPALRTVFGQSTVAIDADDNVYVSYIYPYRIVKYDATGHAVLEFSRDLNRNVTPPTVHRKNGKIIGVTRQEISFDVQVGADGLIYNLIRTGGGRGGNIIDVFSTTGKYLQSFYLEANAFAFTLLDEFIAIGTSPPLRSQKIEVFKIVHLN